MTMHSTQTITAIMVYCLVLSIETSVFDSNENALMSVTDSDILMSDSTVALRKRVILITLS